MKIVLVNPSPIVTVGLKHESNRIDDGGFPGIVLSNQHIKARIERQAEVGFLQGDFGVTAKFPEVPQFECR